MRVHDGSSFHLRLLGMGALVRADGRIETLPDQALKTVSLLVLNGACMNRDALVGHIWPDAQVASGRHQLRNVLSRLRLAGLRIDRQGEAVLVLNRVTCDIDQFIMGASRAVAGVDGRMESYRQALAAQQLWSGPPLEAWRYEPWAIAVRNRVFRLQRRLWDMLESIEYGPEWPPRDLGSIESPHYATPPSSAPKPV